jgi:hypothetical protein
MCGFDQTVACAALLSDHAVYDNSLLLGKLLPPLVSGSLLDESVDPMKVYFRHLYINNYFLLV